MKPFAVGRRLIRTLVVIGAMACLMSLLVPPVKAAHPGTNGKILFEGWGNINESTESDAGQYDIWTVEPDGSGLVNLTNAPGVDTDGKWSPDGTRIVFSSNRSGRERRDYDIYVMNADGSHLKRLTSTPGTQSYASWSPNGNKIAFCDERGLWIMKADGSNKRLIYSGTSSGGRLGGNVNMVDWSPDGGLIAFSMDAGEGTGEDIWVIRPDASGMRRLFAGDGNDMDPDFSPDGRLVAFSSGNSCIPLPLGWCFSDVLVIRRDGRDVRNLTATTTLIEYDPAWSPDGSQIAYAGDNVNAGRDLDIWTMDADGQNRKPLVLHPETYDYQPNWQPIAD